MNTDADDAQQRGEECSRSKEKLCCEQSKAPFRSLLEQYQAFGLEDDHRSTKNGQKNYKADDGRKEGKDPGGRVCAVQKRTFVSDKRKVRDFKKKGSQIVEEDCEVETSTVCNRPERPVV